MYDIVVKKYERRVRCVDVNREICKWLSGIGVQSKYQETRKRKGETKPDTFCRYITYNLDTFCKMTGDIIKLHDNY